MSFLVVVKKNTTGLYETLLKWPIFLSVPVTMYTAVIMGQASARELWQTPAELIQMMLAAFLVGSATLAFFSPKWSKEAKRDLAIILGMSAFLSFTIYMGEYFLSWKLAEAEATMAYVHSGGEYNMLFWAGQIIGFILPAIFSFMATRNGSAPLLQIAAILSIIGLYMAKHVWLVIPQLLSLS
jgi:hypothetical protein